MPQLLYCSRCQTDIPMLDEQEWERVGAALRNPVQTIRAYREQHGVGLAQAQQEAFGEVLELYREITGFVETNPRALWHHRAALYGPPCVACGKPLRTPAAKRCFECGKDCPSRAVGD